MSPRRTGRRRHPPGLRRPASRRTPFSTQRQSLRLPPQEHPSPRARRRHPSGPCRSHADPAGRRPPLEQLPHLGCRPDAHREGTPRPGRPRPGPLDRDIARSLFVSASTVKTVVSSLMRKLDAPTRTRVVAVKGPRTGAPVERQPCLPRRSLPGRMGVLFPGPGHARGRQLVRAVGGHGGQRQAPARDRCAGSGQVRRVRTKAHAAAPLEDGCHGYTRSVCP